MSDNQFLPGVRGLGAHTQSGMIHSILSPYPNKYNILYTNFLNLNKIPKATITDIEMNLTGVLNFKDSNANSQTDASLFNIGLNSTNQLYIKTQAEDDSLGGANPPAILIDTNGDVYINGSTSSQNSGFLFEFDTQGITQYNRKTANLGVIGPNYWTDPTTGNERWDNIFFGAPPVGSFAWNVKNIPSTTPTNQFVYNSSPIPGSSAPGFRTFATTAAPLPVDCVVYGEFFGVPPSPDGALIGGVGHTYSNTPITNNFTASFTLTVGIVKQSWDPTGSPPVVNELVASQDIDVPFRGTYVGTVASFSCNFAFEMTETDPVSGLPISYIPFFNHNGIIYPATDANIRWRNVTVSFTTKPNL